MVIGLSITPSASSALLISPSSRMMNMIASVRTKRFDQNGMVIRSTHQLRCAGGRVAMK